jgi:hypothetical protein
MEDRSKEKYREYCKARNKVKKLTRKERKERKTSGRICKIKQQKLLLHHYGVRGSWIKSFLANRD